MRLLLQYLHQPVRHVDHHVMAARHVVAAPAGLLLRLGHELVEPWVRHGGGADVASFRQIARLRLARVLLVEQKPSDAIKILEKVDDKNFNGLINEIRGDGYLAMKNLEIARQSYKEALRELPDAETIRPLLQMKYDNLVMNP